MFHFEICIPSAKQRNSQGTNPRTRGHSKLKRPPGVGISSGTSDRGLCRNFGTCIYSLLHLRVLYVVMGRFALPGSVAAPSRQLLRQRQSLSEKTLRRPRILNWTSSLLRLPSGCSEARVCRYEELCFRSPCFWYLYVVTRMCLLLRTAGGQLVAIETESASCFLNGQLQHQHIGLHEEVEE